jgi:hypothetical protein
MQNELVFSGILIVPSEKRKRNTENTLVRFVSIFVNQDNI